MHRPLTWLCAGAATAALAVATAGAAGAAPAVGNKASFTPDISANGRFVVFASDATNLVAGDTNGKRDIFIRDLVAKTTRLVSKAPSGAAANGQSFWASVSGDGRYVAFMSDASNLVSGDTNGTSDAFRADLSTGKIVRVSVASSGAQANARSRGGQISGNGRYVVFDSDASNLAAGDTNGQRDVFLRDVVGGTTTRLAKDPLGKQLFSGQDASINDDGSVVGIMAASMGNGDSGLLEWRRATGKTTWVDKDYDDDGLWSSPDRAATRSGGTSFSELWSTETSGAGWYVQVRASSSRSFSVGDDYDGLDSTLAGFDVNRAGTVAAIKYAFAGGARLQIVNRTAGIADTAAALAVKNVASSWPLDQSVAMSADGTWVSYVETNGQVMRWNWQTGATTTVSTS